MSDHALPPLERFFAKKNADSEIDFAQLENGNCEVRLIKGNTVVGRVYLTPVDCWSLGLRLHHWPTPVVNQEKST